MGNSSILRQEKENHHFIRSVQPEINYANDEKSHLLVLPYVGQKREKSIKSMKTALKYHSPNNIVTKSAYSASKWSNKFNIKSKIKRDHQHDITYYVKYLEEICRERYIGEKGRRLSECVVNHSGSDKNAQVLKYCIKKEHKLPSLEDFMILRANYQKNRFRWKLSESLYTKEKRSPLSTQEKSVTLKLFNWLGSLARTNQISAVKFFVKTVNVFKPLVVFEKGFILDVFWLVSFLATLLWVW